MSQAASETSAAVDTVPSRYTLPQYATADRRRARAALLTEKRKTYRFEQDTLGGHPDPATDFLLPPHAAEVPPEADFPLSKKARLLTHQLRLIGNVIFLKLFNYDYNPMSAAAYRRTLGLIPPPSVSGRWSELEEFGRQRLAGVNPMSIERCPEAPGAELLAAADRVLGGFGTTAKRALEEQRLFQTRYSILADPMIAAQVAKGMVLTAPTCLFYADRRGRLQPLAIQLHPPDDARPNPVFTPLDGKPEWQIARAHAQAADAHYHEGVFHLLETHMVTEAFALAAKRTLHPDHPLSQLLIPHFEYNLPIDRLARTKMLAPGGAIAVAMAAGPGGSLDAARMVWSGWEWKKRTLHADLGLRGVDKQSTLPIYPYRDDALEVWHALHHYVHGIVGIWYRPDEGEDDPEGNRSEASAYSASRPDNRNVVDDSELQAWLEELRNPLGAHIKGLPEVKTRTALVRFVTDVIFRGSAQHAAVNNGQFGNYGYIPNSATKLMPPLPTSPNGGLKDEDYFAILPRRDSCITQIGMVWVLSEPTERSLLRSGECPAFAPDICNAAYEVVGRLRRRLRSIVDVIQRRNGDKQTRPVPYTYLNPHNIDRSIAI